MYFKNLGIAFDQMLNAFLFGWPDETLSSRAYRLALAGWPLPAQVIDCVFFWQKEHCKESFESERLGRQQPPELRPKPYQ